MSMGIWILNGRKGNKKEKRLKKEGKKFEKISTQLFTVLTIML